jgi:hypothetical protein
MALVLESKASASETFSLNDASFEPYGRLLRMLMPTLRGIVVHDGYSNLVWASDEWNLAEYPEIINEAIANALADSEPFAGIVRTLDEDNVVYAFAVRAQRSELLGVVSLIVRLTGTQTEARPLQYVRPLVRDLSLMLEMSSRQSAAASDADEFDLILKTGIEHMRCALAALWVPDKNIELTLTLAAHGSGIAQACATASAGLDAAAAAHDRRQPHCQSRERRGRSI